MSTLPLDLTISALDAAPDAIVIIDGDGRVVYANRQVFALFGRPAPDIIGQPVEVLMPARFRAAHPGHRHSFVEHARVRSMGERLDLFGMRPDGSEFPVEISLSPIGTSAAGGRLIAAAIRDATERKRNEAELVAAREAAVRASQAKGRFLATASHDLRQPLQTLSLLNGALRRAVTNPEAYQALAQQEQAIGAMSRLLNALLDISKLESGAVRPELQDFAADALFEEMRQEFGRIAASKGLTLLVSKADQDIYSDRALVEQILKNLLSNAIKYTREGWVALRCLRGAGDTMRIEVQDTGIGIAPDQLQLIFDEFYQVGVPANSSRDGYGLGLSIVQRLVTLLGASIEVDSAPGRGTTFALTLPAGRQHQVDAAPTSRPTPVPAQQLHHLLLVEDDASVRKAMQLLLKSEGYAVTATADAADALVQGLGMPGLDLVLTDYHLGGGRTGLEVITELRARLGRNIKAILVTGDTSAAVRDLKRDPDLRLACKPINAEELLQMMRALLGR